LRKGGITEGRAESGGREGMEGDDGQGGRVLLKGEVGRGGWGGGEGGGKGGGRDGGERGGGEEEVLGDEGKGKKEGVRRVARRGVKREMWGRGGRD